jgi:hypothetical protein
MLDTAAFAALLDAAPDAIIARDRQGRNTLVDVPEKPFTEAVLMVREVLDAGPPS